MSCMRLSLIISVCIDMMRCSALCCSPLVLYWTHSTDARGQDHPAPLDEEDRFVTNHVFDVRVESVTT